MSAAQCVVGRWFTDLDREDKQAFKQAVGRMSRVELHGHVCTAHGAKPYGLTALKDHLLHRCVCD